MYSLYHDKEKNKIEIKKITNKNSLFHMRTDRYKPQEVNYWNQNYYISDNVEALKEKAKIIKELWLLEFRMRVSILEKMRITVKNK